MAGPITAAQRAIAQESSSVRCLPPRQPSHARQATLDSRVQRRLDSDLHQDPQAMELGGWLDDAASRNCRKTSSRLAARSNPDVSQHAKWRPTGSSSTAVHPAAGTPSVGCRLCLMRRGRTRPDPLELAGACNWLRDGPLWQFLRGGRLRTLISRRLRDRH